MGHSHPKDPNSTAAVQIFLDRIRDGDADAIQSLLISTIERLRVLAKKISGNIPGVMRFEQTDDLLQNSLLRLWRAFEKNHPPTPLDFYRLAASLMRRELIDMSRHHFGPEGMGANLAKVASQDDTGVLSPIDLQHDDTSEQNKLGQWTEFHEYVDQLEEDEKLLFDLLWYQGLTLEAAAEVAGSSERTIRRRWKAARLTLYRELMES